MTKASKKRKDRRTEEPAEQTLSAVRAWEVGGKVGEKPPRLRTGPQCAAHTTSGQPCYNPPMIGSRTCRKHGSAAPQVKKAARERLLELVDPAIAALDKVLRDPSTEDAVKVRASTAILDRCGFRPGVMVEINPGDRWSGLLGEVTAGADDRSGLLIEAATEDLASEHEAERVQGVLAELDALNQEDAEARRETRINNDGHTVVRATGDGTYSVFPQRGEGPTDRRSEYDPTEPGRGAQTREQILLERLEEPDEEPGTWRSGH